MTKDNFWVNVDGKSWGGFYHNNKKYDAQELINSCNIEEYIVVRRELIKSLLSTIRSLKQQVKQHESNKNFRS